MEVKAYMDPCFTFIPGCLITQTQLDIEHLDKLHVHHTTTVLWCFETIVLYFYYLLSMATSKKK
jgi:hypothetical protein